MHRQHPVRPQRHVLLAQPADQGLSVGCLQQSVQRVQAFGAAETKSHGQGVQVVVAQQTLGTALQRHQAAQHAH